MLFHAPTFCYCSFTQPTDGMNGAVRTLASVIQLAPRDCERARTRQTIHVIGHVFILGLHRSWSTLSWSAPSFRRGSWRSERVTCTLTAVSVSRRPQPPEMMLQAACCSILVDKLIVLKRLILLLCLTGLLNVDTVRSQQHYRPGRRWVSFKDSCFSADYVGCFLKWNLVWKVQLTFR